MQKSSAKRRGSSVKNSTKKKSSKRLLKVFVLSVMVIAAVLTLVKPKHWDGKSKMSIVYPLNSGEVQVSVFDPQSGEILSITIPENLEIEAARGFGVWKAGSLWELGEKEDLGGSLLAQSVTKHLKFPTPFWIGPEGLGLAEGKFTRLIPFFLTTNTNIPMQDRIRLAIFSMSVNNPGRSQIDLTRTTYIRTKVLADDVDGFGVSGSIPQGLAAIFTDNTIANELVRVEIIDGTIASNAAENVGALLEVLGAKTASVKDTDSVETNGADCLVSSNKNDLSQRLAFLLGCSISKSHNSNFDIEIVLSEEFDQRF